MSVDQATLRIQAAKQKVEAARMERAKAEERMQHLQAQAEQVKAECAALGVTPEGLDAEIARLEAERDANLSEAERLLQGA